MQYRRLGRTELEASRLVLGAGHVGGFVFLQDRAVAEAMLRRAFEAGINWIDTAARYGNGRSEEALGELLPGLDQTPYLSTKVRLDIRRQADIAGQIEAGISGSLKRLRRDSVDLLQLHNHIGGGRSEALSVDHVLGEEGVADCFDRLKAEGFIRFGGITALGDAESVKAVVESGRFDTAQVYYNMLNPSAGRSVMPAAWQGDDYSGLLAACRAADVGVLNIRVFAGGVLASAERHGREAVLSAATALAAEEARAQAVFDALAKSEPAGSAADDAPAQDALRFALANPDIDCIVLGLAEPEHLDLALDAAGRGPMGISRLDILEQVYTRGFATV